MAENVTEKVCAVEWCVAYVFPGKQCCEIHHFHGRNFRPAVIERRPARRKQWPPTPWDDEMEENGRKTHEYEPRT